MAVAGIFVKSGSFSVLIKLNNKRHIFCFFLRVKTQWFSEVFCTFSEDERAQGEMSSEMRR